MSDLKDTQKEETMTQDGKAAEENITKQEDEAEQDIPRDESVSDA
ncbi:hypothetical protein EVJ58_g9401 [Rhodofomes roseus]|uniref:Uncharacterized protein n=1 Tax=Rhodofomes roseus TaxID=34475 RepID=A0A4Y9XY91_9APHY|nr:hypothetical protein EVJ58_g9401 [Rhodofomes roseus]